MAHAALIVGPYHQVVGPIESRHRVPAVEPRPAHGVIHAEFGREIGIEQRGIGRIVEHGSRHPELQLVAAEPDLDWSRAATGVDPGRRPVAEPEASGGIGEVQTRGAPRHERESRHAHADHQIASPSRMSQDLPALLYPVRRRLQSFTHLSALEEKPARTFHPRFRR